jgi:hypothetical protein
MLYSRIEDINGIESIIMLVGFEYKVIYTETPVLLVDHKTLSRISKQLKKLSGSNYVSVKSNRSTFYIPGE